MKLSLLALLAFAAVWLAGCSPPPAAAVNATATRSESASLVSETAAGWETLPPTAAPSLSPTKPPAPTATELPPSPSALPTGRASAANPSPVPSLTPIPSAAPTLPPGPDDWQDLPVIPAISDEMLKIYARGLELGNNPQAFSKIGDCGSTPAWFLGDFDRGPRFYRLGEHEQLSAVIEYFQGSFDRTSLAARSGFNASALFVPLWADLKFCQADEAPLACEYRVHKPVIAFIMLGSNDVWHPEEYEPQMRKIIEFSIENGVIPILATKADNQEGDGSINATTARLAQEYQVPLWNFWKAVAELPNHGLQEDGVHLSFSANNFDDPLAMQTAWPIRNLTALQVLNAVWEKIFRVE